MWTVIKGSDTLKRITTLEEASAKTWSGILWLSRLQVPPSQITPAPPFSPSQGEKTG